MDALQTCDDILHAGTLSLLGCDLVDLCKTQSCLIGILVRRCLPCDPCRQCSLKTVTVLCVRQ